MQVKLTPIADGGRAALENMFQLYLHDMSEFGGWPVGDDGRFAFEDDLLSPYWERADHWPYFIMAGDEVAGFSLVRAAPDSPELLDMGQFFTLRAYRGKGVGMRAFRQSISMHPGRWQVRVLEQNIPARTFWGKATAAVAEGEVEISNRLYHRHKMLFHSFSAR